MLKHKLQLFFKTFLCLLLALLIASPASAADSSYIQSAALNGSYWYDPSALNSSCFSSDISISGSTAAQKIWSGLITFMTPEQAAGVIGNMASEGGFNPVRHEISKKNALWPGFDIMNDVSDSYGIGLIQWSWGRRTKLLHYIQSNDSSLIQYFMNPDTYSTYGSGDKTSGDVFLEKVGDAVFDRLIQLELEVLKNELNISYSDFFNQTTVYDAAKYFLERVERPANPTIEAHPERATAAQTFYDQLNGASLTPSGSNGTNISGSSITIIGDSITARSSSSLSNKLPGVEINAEVGRSFATGIDIARSMELRNVVVFALGTNSRNVSSDQIQEVIDLVGPSRSLYFLTNYGVGYDFTNNNRLFNEAAARNSNVNVIDWASSVSSSPDKYIAVNESTPVHPTADGITLFTDLISNAVTSKNLTSDGCTVSGDFQSTVLAYAWPTPSDPVSTVNQATPKPEYAAAVARRRAANKYIGTNGIDCGCFVAAVLTDSGFAPGYRDNGMGGEEWVIANGWTLLNPDENTPISDTSILQPGDVAFSNGAPGNAGHTFLYVGDIPGFGSKIASASTGPTWRAPMAGTESLTQSNFGGYPVRWYRKG